MNAKRYIILFLYVSVICVFAGSDIRADTVIPYELNNGWTYAEGYPDTLLLTENPSGGIIVNINIPTGIDDGGLVASRHDLPDYSLHDHGFIQLEYSSFSSEITGNSQGPDMCLEIQFRDAEELNYEMAIAVSQDTEGFYFETWFGSEPDSSYYQTPVPDGLSLAEGALGLYSNDSLVRPYFIDADGSVFYPFDASFDPWDVSGITDTHEYSVDNDFEGTTTAGGTITASVNLKQVVYGSGAPAPEYPISDHVLKIEVSTTYNYDYPEVPLHYEFDAWIQVDSTVVSGSMMAPDESEYEMIYESDGSDSWFGVNFDNPDPSFLDNFGDGTYTFTVNYEDGSSDSTSIEYQLPGGGPIPYVTQEPQFIYPQHNAIGLPLNCTFQFDPAINPDHTIQIWIEPVEAMSGALSYIEDNLSYDTSSYGPVTLSPETLYEGGYSINYCVNTTNEDGIPVVMDTDAETQIHFTTASPIDVDPIEEILDLIDESVEDGTLVGDGPGKSANNRLNALRNKLEDVRRLIEAERYEEACDQLWSTYRKCDGNPRPPDFVTGEAAEDLAVMILLLMDDLGC